LVSKDDKTSSFTCRISSTTEGDQMRILRTALAPLLALSLLGIAIGTAAASVNAKVHASAALPTIVIGNEGFTESFIMQDIYGDLLTNAGFKVQLLAQASATRQEALPALEAGKIDVLPDYAGSLLVDLAPKDTMQAGTLATAESALKPILAIHGATVLPGTTGLDQNVFVVTDTTKAKYHLTTISSIKAHASSWIFGAPTECSKNYFCLPGLESVYGLKFKQVKTLDDSGPLSVTALKSGTAQVVELFSTDNIITSDKFYVLQDNLNLEPADHLIPVVRTSFDTPTVQKALASVNALLTTSVLTQLDAAVSGSSHPTPAAVAEGFLVQEKLIK
jgi:osmoprotectant transport system substrate-binding protein